MDAEKMIPGMIQKAAQIAANEPTEEDMKLINKHALSPLTSEEVFTFKAILCDNEVDRTFERFTQKALQDLQKLFLGRTVIKDHIRCADNQVARIYATELVENGKTLKSGEKYMQLVAHCYMVRTAGNADLIAEIKGGIKKEGSIGCSVTGSICSICGTDNTKSYCRHWAGRSYEKEGGAEVCTYTLTGARDAYEFSLVAVPAQRAAGVKKSYMGTPVYETEPEEKQNSEECSVKELFLQAKITELLTKIHKED
ncbi:MAG: hypothetical protein IJN11_05710 [Oscillospiraceae bacterium]|nr:hypothetical protein [Oscillospiraceae bacterium]